MSIHVSGISVGVLAIDLRKLVAAYGYVFMAVVFRNRGDGRRNQYACRLVPIPVP